MFIFSFRMPFRRIAAISVVLALALLVLIYGLLLRPSAPVHPLAGGTEEERLGFLASWGWEVSPAGGWVEEVQIPSTFDEVYGNYNQMQLEQGFDLEKYAGERVRRYSYPLTNYPNSGDDIRANLLVYRGKIIGGDISSQRENGFSTGFDGKSE